MSSICFSQNERWLGAEGAVCKDSTGGCGVRDDVGPPPAGSISPSQTTTTHDIMDVCGGGGCAS